MSFVAGGGNKLSIVKYKNKKIDKVLSFPSVTSIKHPAWSSDGTRIAFSGMVKGKSDIYVYNLETQILERLTHDIYSDVMPHWSNDDAQIIFSSDRGKEADTTIFKFSDLKLCILDTDSKEVTTIPAFETGNHIDPHFANNNKEIFFIAAPDGVSNIYKKDITNGKIDKITNTATGISGITATSPALSVALNTNDIIFSTFEKGNYVIYKIDYDSHQKHSFSINPDYLEREEENIFSSDQEEKTFHSSLFRRYYSEIHENA